MRILIVEDEPVIALEIEAIVQERLPHAETTLAASVREAMDVLDHGVGFAFLDIDVTDGKSYPLALELRSRSIPFVFVSGAMRHDAPHGLAEERMVRKPFTPGDIVRQLAVLDTRDAE
ncbi:response regulator [Chelatococcus sambhunathii]|uniref:Response regulator n=1 Tax=Chelatococcus sambhunathii TaxID=363953 RepID=A0ABU1DI48_9HYPH|nr:response regulator [Chelatococcus sambhunathii]MDR4307812.1 response regulator [Chelatococcus sambhunathii]